MLSCRVTSCYRALGGAGYQTVSLDAMPRFPVTTAVLLGLLAGCAAPDLGPRPAPAAPESLTSGESFAAAAGVWPVEGWWQAWGDAQLGALIDEGLAGDRESTGLNSSH